MVQFDTTDVTPESLEGSQPPEAPATYHLQIIAAGLTKSGKGFAFTFYVLDGTTPGQEGRTFQDNFTFPASDQKDGGDFLKRRLSKLAIATRVRSIADLGQSWSLEESEFDGMQLVAAVKLDTFRDDKGNERTSVKIDGMKMFDPLDPDVASVPRNAEYLSFLDGPLEQPEEKPAKAESAKPAAKAGPRKPGAAKPAPAAAGADKYDV